MAWLSFNRLYPFLEWIWRKLGLLKRYILPIAGFALLAIGWRKIPGRRRDDCEIGDEDKPPVAHCEGQNVAVAGDSADRAAGSDTEPASELPECLENDDDDEDEDGLDGERDASEPSCEETEEEEEELDSGKYRVGPRCNDNDDGQFDREKYQVEPRYEDDDEEEEFDSKKYRVETTDELYCGYDSTWEAEENQQNTLRSSRRPAAPRHYKFSRFESAARDMQNYRHGYPNRPQYWIRPLSDEKPNLSFYLGQKPSLPDGVYIHNFHNEWAKDYEALEHVHTYIQWLFPLQEPGMNYEARPLTKEEILCFLESSTAKKNLLKSYKLMLDFYGMELCNENTGEVKRALNWKDRFNNLNTHTHNNLRITRILKCQGTLGYPHYQAPLVRFFLEETLVHGELPNVKESVLNYFVFAVLDKKQRRSLIKYAYLNYDRKDEFVWCPKKIQMMWSRPSHATAKKEK